LRKWKHLVAEFQGVTTLIPQCYFEFLAKEEGQCFLVGFCDASARAYAAVIYSKIEEVLALQSTL